MTDPLQILFEQLPDPTKKGKARPVPTKKRSAPGAGSGAIPIPAQARQQPRRTEDTLRAAAGVSHEQIRHMAHRISFDPAQQRLANGRSGQPFVPNYSELLPLDVSSATGSPDSAGTPSTSHRSAASFPPQTAAGGSANPLYKLDAMMFPSEDPFAYPNQPAMDFALQQHQGRSGQPGGHPNAGPPHHQDAVPFYMPNMYGDIEGQLLGPIPPYLVQSSHGQGVDLSAQVYNASGILPVSLQQAHLQQAQQQAAQQQQQREIEALLADPNFEAFTTNYRNL